jgi:ankyrin repeat protein
MDLREKEYYTKASNTSYLPFREVCAYRNIAMMLLKIRIGIDMNNSLYIASRYGHIRIVKLLLAAGSDVRSNNTLSLRWASRCGHINIVKILIDAGSDVNASDDYSLTHASHDGHINTVKLLLESGANVHIDDDYPLQQACTRGWTRLVKLLLNMGSNINTSSLLWAVINHHIQIIKTLIKAGANIHDNNDHVLDVASSHSHADIVKMFLILGAKSDNALVYASSHGHINVVRVLLDHGFDPCIHNNAALVLAEQNGYTEIVSMLQNHIDTHR